MRLYYQQLLADAGWPTWLVPNYAFMLCLSIVLGSLWTIRLWTGRGHPRAIASDLVFWAIPGLFIGARLLFLLQFGFPDTWTEVFLAQGIALYGGFFGVVTPWIILYWIRPYDVRSMLDCVTPAFALGLFLVRIGCFLQGCNGGLVCSYPWAMQFPRGTSSYLAQVQAGIIQGTEAFSQPIHPTQLYESLFGLVCIPLLYLLFQRSQRPGETFCVGMLAYAIYRFSTELIRSDTQGVHPLGLTFAQFVSLVIAAASLSALFWIWYQARESHLEPEFES